MIRKFDTAYFMISVDTLADNKAFAEKEHADFPLLANPDKKVAFAYGVIAPDAPPERQFARRWTFYIDPNGKIAAIDKAIKPGSSGEDIVAHLQELKVPTK
jgi:peroxiredoxin Q/BCP